MAPIIQTRNADAQLLGSPDHLWAKDRNFVLEAYGGGAENFIAETVLAVTTVRQNYTPELYDLDSSILTLFEAGVYQFCYRSTFSMSGGGAGQAIIYLQQDPATGTFATVLASAYYLYLPAGLNATFQVVLPLLVGIDYRYRIAAIRSSGAGFVQSLNQSTNLSVSLLLNNT